MIFMDVAVGPMYAVIGGTFLLIIGAAVGLAFLAAWLIKKVIKKNKGDK